MINLQDIKSAIPLLFAFLIIGFIAKLGYDNIQLESDNNSLRADVRQLNKKNDGLTKPEITDILNLYIPQLKDWRWQTTSREPCSSVTVLSKGRRI